MVDRRSNLLQFDLTRADGGVAVTWELPVAAVVDSYDGAREVQVGEKVIKIWSDSREGESRLLNWFTPDKLLYDVWLGHIDAELPHECSAMTTFQLLYVGISKKGDSFSRLFSTPHHGRLKVLSNERAKVSNLRVTDEMTLFMFDIEGTGIRQCEADEDLGDAFTAFLPEMTAVFADAEKALVNLLHPRYNEQRYNAYPKGKDGLHGANLHRYAFSFGDRLRFETETGRIQGSPTEGQYDVVIVCGDNVTVHKFDTAEPEGSAVDP